MILPFLSSAWSAYSGQYGEAAVRILCDSANVGRYASPFVNARKKGRKIVVFQNAEIAAPLFRHPKDRLQGKYLGLWASAGIEATVATFGTVVEQLFAAKVDLDLAVFDVENGFNPWSMSAADFAATYADPRYKALVATGRFPADCRNMDENERQLFQYGCSYLNDAVMMKGLIAPLYKRYDNLQWCNFNDRPCSKEDAVFAREFNGHAEYQSKSSAPVYSPMLYAGVGQLAISDPRFKQPFYVVALMANHVRVVYRAVPDASIMPWVAPRVQSNVLDQAYWLELIFQTCCLVGTNLLYFNAFDFSALSNWRFDNAISQFIGKARGKTWKSVLTTDLVQFDSAKFVYSACRLSDDSVVGRVTFKPGVDTATFKVDGRNYTVTRPAGGVGEWFHS